ncbi:helicase superfamily 1/2 ATP-binding domain protein [Vibrio phage Va2]|nr:helicase superfamily 1/2 ATP-binding domain protein [Vibrio phage Va2]
MLKLFPYHSPRPAQGMVIEDLNKELDNEDLDIFLLELPTGIGKSAIAYTIAKHYEAQGVRTRILTRTKNLQAQYLEEFPDIQTVMGKSNYKDEDAHSDALVNFCNSHIGVTNYSNMEHCRLMADDVLVIDEAHEFLEHLNEKMYFRISLNTKSTYLSRILERGTQWSRSRVRSIRKNVMFEFRAMIGRLEKTGFYDNELASFNQILSICEDDTPVFFNTTDTHLEIYVKGAPEYLRYLTYEYHRVILMSASFGGIDFYKEVLGIDTAEKIDNQPDEDDEEWIYTGESVVSPGLNSFTRIVEESPFSPESRPIKFITSNSVGMSDREERVESLVEDSIDRLIEMEHDGTNGIIHTVSYEYAKLVKECSSYSERMYIVKTMKEVLEIMEERNDAIFLSPALETGVSFKGDAATWQLVMKAPIEPVFGVNKFLVRLYGRRYLNRKGAMRVQQMAGRIIRSEKCKGTTYIIDKNFSRISGSKSREFYSKYFWDNFKKYNSIDEIQFVKTTPGAIRLTWNKGNRGWNQKWIQLVAKKYQSTLGNFIKEVDVSGRWMLIFENGALLGTTTREGSGVIEHYRIGPSSDMNSRGKVSESKYSNELKVRGVIFKQVPTGAKSIKQFLPK